MLLTLRGTPFLYYGEEIGMRNVPIPDERLQDPARLHPAPEPLARSRADADAVGARARAPASRAASPGSRSATPARGTSPASAATRASLLHFYRELLALRRAHPALHAGSFRRLEAPEGVLAFERRAGDERALVALSFAGEPRELRLADARGAAARSPPIPGARSPRAPGASCSAPSEGLLLLLA